MNDFIDELVTFRTFRNALDSLNSQNVVVQIKRPDGLGYMVCNLSVRSFVQAAHYMEETPIIEPLK